MWLLKYEAERCYYLHSAVVLASRLAPHVAGVAAAGAALDLHAGRPDDEVGRGGIHLAPGDLINGCSHFTRGWQGLFHHWGSKSVKRLKKFSSDKHLETHHVHTLTAGNSKISLVYFYHVYVECVCYQHSSCDGCVCALSSGRGSCEKSPCGSCVWSHRSPRSLHQTKQHTPCQLHTG